MIIYVYFYSFTVAHIMKTMGYMPSMGLAKRNYHVHELIKETKNKSMNPLILRLKLIGKDWYIEREWRKTLETSLPP